MTMRRREFVTLLGGAAAGWPLAARAQQGGRVRRIGVLISGEENDALPKTMVSAFIQALAGLGWTDGCSHVAHRGGAAACFDNRGFQLIGQSLKDRLRNRAQYWRAWC